MNNCLEFDNKARHDKVVSLVERMLELHKTPSARTPQDKERVARVPERATGIEKIEPSADRAIDRLVSPTGTAPHKGTSYELSHKAMIPHKGAMYWLMEDEIRIVES